MMKFIASGVLGAVTMAGTGYTYLSTQNAKLEAAQRTALDAKADADAARTTLANENAAIDHIMGELRDLRGVNAK